MIDKIKAIPEKKAFVIGLALLSVSPILFFLMSYLFPLDIWLTMIIEGIVCFIAFTFILSAADKRHARIGKK